MHNGFAAYMWSNAAIKVKLYTSKGLWFKINAYIPAMFMTEKYQNHTMWYSSTGNLLHRLWDLTIIYGLYLQSGNARQLSSR